MRKNWILWLRFRILYFTLFILTFFKESKCILHPDGHSTVSRYQDELGNYQFAYTATDGGGEHFHKAGTDPLGRVVGSYGMTLSDGRHRLVDYVADKNGFRAHVRSNEPGLISSNSADATVERIDEPTNSKQTFLNELHGHQRLELAASNDGSTNEVQSASKHTSSRVIYLRPDENEEHKREHVELLDDEDDDDKDDLDKSVTRRDRILKDIEHIFDDKRNSEKESVSKTSEFDEPLESIPFLELPKPDLKDTSDKIISSTGYNPPIDPKSVVPPTELQRRQSSNPYFISRYDDHNDPSTPIYSGFGFKSFNNNNNNFGKYPSPSDFPHFSFPSFSYHDYDEDHRHTLSPLFPDHGKVTMSTIHGGFSGQYPFKPQEGVFGARLNPHLRTRLFSLPPVHHPTYGPGVSPNYIGEKVPSTPPNPNLVLRAVAIPNGIQAVPVNPQTGQVHNDGKFQIHDPNFRGPSNDPHYSHPNDRDAGTFFNYPVHNNHPPFSGHSPSHSPSHSANPLNRGHHGTELKHKLDASLSKPSSKDLAVISRTIPRANNQRNFGTRLNPHQLDSVPDYPPHKIIHSKYETPKTDYEYDDEYKDYYNNQPVTKLPVHRPSIAVRLPGFDRSRNSRLGNNRDYRSLPKNNRNNGQDDEIKSSASEISKDISTFQFKKA